MEPGQISSHLEIGIQCKLSLWHVGCGNISHGSNHIKANPAVVFLCQHYFCFLVFYFTNIQSTDCLPGYPPNLPIKHMLQRPSGCVIQAK